MKIAFVHNLKKSNDEFEAEFDTPEVVAAIAKGIESQKHTVIPIEMTQNGTWIDELLQSESDLVFNTAEGYRGVGREAYAPVVFEQLGIPFVGSGSYTCFLTLDKFLSKQIVARAGVRVIPGFFLSRIENLETMRNAVEFPAFVKPNFEGSSKGISKESICKDFDELKSRCEDLLKRFPEGLIVEHFVEGKDITIPFVQGVGDTGVMDPVEYVLLGDRSSSVYDFELKNERDDMVEVRCPAQFSDEILNEARRSMLHCVRSLGVVDMARADFRVSSNGTLYFIELNALPSLQPGAGLFEASKNYDLDYGRTLGAIISSAQKRHKLKERSIPMRNTKLNKPKVALVYNLKRKESSDADYESEAEFDSIETIDAIFGAIKETGVEAMKIEADQNLITSLRENKINIVFNIAEGQGPRSREAQVPAICDFLKIEHTGSDAACLALSLDKFMSCQIAASAGIKVPRGRVLQDKNLPKDLNLDFPLIVKPNHEGTSKGIHGHSVARNAEELQKLVTDLFQNYASQVLLQEYISGRELTVGVIGSQRPKVLRPLEIAFKEKAGELPVYSFEHKQLPDQLDNDYLKMECPAQLTEDEWKDVRRSARAAFHVLGCRDVARVDFRLNEKGCYFIEINPLPGLSPGFSDLSIMADKQGMSYEKLIASILKPAIIRWKRRKTLYG